MKNILNSQIIAAVRTEVDFNKALHNSHIKTIFLLNSNILNIKDYIARAKSSNKIIFVHFDFIDGIGKDKFGVEYLLKCNAGGIISTRTNIIKYANEFGLTTVQRFFIIDSHSVDTAIESIKASKTDMIEIMPGIIYKKLVEFKNRIHTPIISGGLIESKEEVEKALSTGATAVSTANVELWNYYE